MKKHKSEKAFHDRLKHLAGVSKTVISESQNRNLGTLINYTRASDGVAYGIVKEQHNYYIKKGGLNENLDVADFAYIGGLSNITSYQFSKLSEADKQRNMMLNVINEAMTTKVSKSGSKRSMLTEDKIGQEIDMAASKADDLDAATAEMDIDLDTDGAAEMDAGLEAMDDAPSPDMGGEESTDGEELPDMGGEELPDMGGEESTDGEELPDMGGEESTDGDGEEVATEDPQSETIREIEKNLGKLTNTLRKTEITDSQVKSYVNSFLSAFKDKFPDVDIEDRRAMAEKITKVVPDEDIEDLGQSVEDVEGVDIDSLDVDDEVAENSSRFAQYAESRGYDAQSIQECDEEEMASVVGGFANAEADDEVDIDEKDLKVIALLITPEIIEKLKSEYGHDDFANKVEPFSMEMNETTDDDKIAQINELFGGLSALGKDAAGGIKKGMQAAGKGIQRGAQAAGKGIQKGVDAVGKAGTHISQTYHGGEVSGEVKKLEAAANDLGKRIESLNNRLVKAGQEPINVNDMLGKITDSLSTPDTPLTKAGQPMNTSQANAWRQGSKAKTSVGGVQKGSLSVTEAMTDPAGVEVQPPINEEDGIDIDDLDVSDDSLETNDKSTDVGLSTGFESMGGGVVKPDGAPTTIEVTKGSVNVTMNESERKLRKYVRNRLEERIGKRKPSLNENKKSDVLKKLDKKIDKQLDEYKIGILKEGLNKNIKLTMNRLKK